MMDYFYLFYSTCGSTEFRVRQSISLEGALDYADETFDESGHTPMASVSFKIKKLQVFTCNDGLIYEIGVFRKSKSNHAGVQSAND